MHRRVATAFVLLLATGCISAAETSTGRFSKEYSCPKDQVHSEELGGGAVRVTGCSQTATYVCIKDREAQEYICQKESAVERTAPASQAAPGASVF